MKKLALTIAIVMSMGLSLTAQIDENMYETKGGLFGMGQTMFENPNDEMFLPFEYAEEETFVPETYFGMDDNGNAGLFGLGTTIGGNRNGTNGLIDLPIVHGSNDDQNGPLGSGILLLAGMGAAYLLKNKKKD